MTPSATETRFLQWLADNGAVLPKLEWPAAVGAGGLRGVRATAAIAPFEEMVRVPRRLLISEERCLQDAQLGPVFADNRDVFSRDDPVLALFLVRELARGDQSFFHPYLAILPEPESVQDWTDDERAELRDRRLVDAAMNRTVEIRTFYDRVMARLADRYPGEFPEEQYTLERFTFAWKTVQARSFGRRLPWSALVPFADCLNHANVATSYDFDVDGNGCFRLFPSRGTTYAQGAEAFNSYGRRPNFQLLLDYGFALEDNEWDFVDINMPREMPSTRKVRFATRAKTVVRIDRQSTLDELFPPNLLLATELPLTRPSTESLPPPASSTAPLPSSDNNASEADGVPMSAALEWIRGALVAALDELGGEQAVEEDAQLLGSEIPYRLRAAIIHCSSRRRLVLRMLAQLDTKLASYRKGHESDKNTAAETSSADKPSVVDVPMEKLSIS